MATTPYSEVYYFGRESDWQIDPKLYEMACYRVGGQLIMFWKQNVGKYFNRGRSGGMSKSGRFVHYKPQKKSVRLPNAIDGPWYDPSFRLGYVIIKPVRVGGGADLIQLLKRGVPSGPGAYVPGIGRVKTGRWAGISKMYWKRWDAVFRKECNVATDKVHNEMIRLGAMRNVTIDGNVYADMDDVHTAYLKDPKILWRL